jgi:hypothetical protein
MTSQSVTLGVEPHLGLMTRYLLLFDSYGLVLCEAPSLTRGWVCLLYATGPCQRSLSQVRVPWYSRPYFTVSDLRLVLLVPTREVTGSISAWVPTKLAAVLCDSPQFLQENSGIMLTFISRPFPSISFPFNFNNHLIIRLCRV